MVQVKCGVQIRHAAMPDNIGTLGCVVHSRADPAVRYLLTAAHVIGLGGYARQGDAIEAWLPAEGRWARIAEFERAVRLHDAPGAVQACDAAIAKIVEPGVSDEIEELGAPQGIATGVWPGMGLRFRGAGSGRVVTARVESSGNPVPVIYEDYADGGTFTLQLDNQIAYGVSAGAWAAASRPGDSGALVLDGNGLAVGLHVGRTPPGYPLNASVCTPLEVVLDALDVVLPAATLAPPTAAVALPTAGAAAPGAAGPVSPPVVPAGGAGMVPGSGDADADDRFGVRTFDAFGISMRSLLQPHDVFGGTAWCLAADGVEVGGSLGRTGGKLVTVPRVWQNFGEAIVLAAIRHRVPVELIVATICTESGGNAAAVRPEPGWTSDEETPSRISAGLMQTLISTARNATGNRALTRQKLLDPATSILAGTAYLDLQRMRTRFDPPVVACAYNAGGVYEQAGAANRWRMRQYPIGTGHHADRFVQWFNDCFAYFTQDPAQLPGAAPSLWRLFRS